MQWHGSDAATAATMDSSGVIPFSRYDTLSLTPLRLPSAVFHV